VRKKLDGSYVLKTDRQDLTANEIWCSYILLTRVEDAFRSMKSPLMERPIFQLDRVSLNDSYGFASSAFDLSCSRQKY